MIKTTGTVETSINNDSKNFMTAGYYQQFFSRSQIGKDAFFKKESASLFGILVLFVKVFTLPQSNNFLSFNKNPHTWGTIQFFSKELFDTNSVKHLPLLAFLKQSCFFFVKKPTYFFLKKTKFVLFGKS